MAIRRTRAAWCVVAVSLLAAGCGTAASGTAAGAAPARAASQTASPQPGKALWLRSVQMTSATDGWAVTESGNLTRSTNGGRTWADVMPAAARRLLSASSASEVLDAVDSERAYFAVTASAAQTASAVSTTVSFATDDAGRTWTESAPLRTASQAGFLSFADASHGWLLMSEGAAMGRNPVRVYRTADGGRRWSLTDTGIPVACDKTGMVFGTVTAGWLTSECAATSSDALLVSRDGGVTWTAQHLPVPLGVDGYSAVLSGPEFVHGAGFLTVGQYGGTPALLVTGDLGRTWRRVQLPTGAGSYPQVKFFSQSDGVLVPAGAQGSLGDVCYTTSDGGRTWTAVPQGMHFTQLGISIDFVSQRTAFAWILGGDAQGPSAPPMYETTNSGRTWKSFTPRAGR
jgi:photosystem II stability/assembly factor-like uncharacterized protein